MTGRFLGGSAVAVIIVGMPQTATAVGEVVGKKASDFCLTDQDGAQVRLFDVLNRSAVLLVFYPSDFTMVCTRQLCNYRDNMKSFQELGVQVLGISSNPMESHRQFADKYNFNFSLLTDPGHLVAKQYDCRSVLLFGSVSRAVVIINQQGFVLYRYVEPTTLTHRKADTLLGVIRDLSDARLL
ncbi:MAG: peroxiredoxin [Bdellovibrionales bacterium]|nr:peroxiredoxin [Bdellovibrionales bacterium]